MAPQESVYTFLLHSRDDRLTGAFTQACTLFEMWFLIETRKWFGLAASVCATAGSEVCTGGACTHRLARCEMYVHRCHGFVIALRVGESRAFVTACKRGEGEECRELAAFVPFCKEIWLLLNWELWERRCPSVYNQCVAMLIPELFGVEAIVIGFSRSRSLLLQLRPF